MLQFFDNLLMPTSVVIIVDLAQINFLLLINLVQIKCKNTDANERCINEIIEGQLV